MAKLPKKLPIFLCFIRGEGLIFPEKNVIVKARYIDPENKAQKELLPMKRQTSQDEFFDLQPPLSFIEYLKAPVHTARPARFDRTTAEEGEVSVRGIYLDHRFPDPEGLLDTVTADFSLFVSLCGIGGGRFPIRLQKGPTPCFEAYIIEVTETGCTITAGDTEGIRRGLIYLEDEMTAREGAFLPLGRIERKPWLKSRITRGFFSPTNRPPKNGDELSDNIDYYPDEYLNRLMHDGTNGLWICTSFQQLLPSDIITEYGVGYERRVDKLNRVIAKCRRYGVKVYVFAIEPAGLSRELGPKYPDMIGQETWGNFHYTMCPHSERVRQYCYEAGSRLFTLCPDLGGYISITLGERTTSCASVATKGRTCPRCAGRPQGELLAENVKNLFAGMHAVKPDAECISWTYGHRNCQDEDILDYVRTAPEDAFLMQNFDDRGFENQLGRERQAMDYWLSYVGPSGMFEMTAKAAKKHGKRLFAKMQICCSHEIATLPYIPSPGNVYGKMKGAYRLGVEGVVECWYFGNYPCFMSKAAGDLAFCDDFTDEDAYLHRLASIIYGRGIAEPIVRAWRLFEKGYRLYPLNIMFSYYSPAHDGVVWELSLKPKNFSLPRSWLLLDKPNGDRVCESFLVGHTHEEVLTLLTSMKNYYTRAMAELATVAAYAGEELSDLLSVSAAFLVLCKSTYNIMRFYKLRDMLGTGEGEPRATLAKMRTLVENEMNESRKMIALCENDGRLGYHSEAEGFKFFPDKLRHRIETLRTLLETEFPEVEARIDAGLPPLEYYLGIEEDCKHSYTIRDLPIEEAAWEPISENQGEFRITHDERDLIFEVRTTISYLVIQPEFRLFQVFPGVGIQFKENGRHKLVPAGWSEHWPFARPEVRRAELRKWRLESLPTDEEGRLSVRIRIAKRHTGMRGTAPFKLSVFSYTPPYGIWESEPCPTYTLGKSTLSPGCFGWVKFENGVAYERPAEEE